MGTFGIGYLSWSLSGNGGPHGLAALFIAPDAPFLAERLHEEQPAPVDREIIGGSDLRRAVRGIPHLNKNPILTENQREPENVQRIRERVRYELRKHDPY